MFSPEPRLASGIEAAADICCLKAAVAAAAAAAPASCGVGAGTAMSMAAGGRPAAATAAGMGPTGSAAVGGSAAAGMGPPEGAGIWRWACGSAGACPAGTPRGAAGAPPWADRLFTELAWHAKTRFALYVWRRARGYVLGQAGGLLERVS